MSATKKIKIKDKDGVEEEFTISEEKYIDLMIQRELTHSINVLRSKLRLK